MSIHIFIDYNDDKNPFQIQPNCRLSRMKEVISKALGLSISEFQHFRGLRRLDNLSGDDQYLIEQLGLRTGDIIKVIGEKAGDPDYGDMIGITLVNQGAKFPLKIMATAKVRSIVQFLQQSDLYLPDSIKLFYQGQQLIDYDKELLSYGVKPGDTVDFEGKFFPAKLLGYTFLENRGVRVSSECVVCYGPIAKLRPFDCGHGNVCESCRTTVTVCPLCRG